MNPQAQNQGCQNQGDKYLHFYSLNNPVNQFPQKKHQSFHHKFSEEEDFRLRNLVTCFGAKKWVRIASMMPGRTARQCRDRYSNYLAPGFIQSEWSIEEDDLLLNKYLEYGSQWTRIREFFPNRTANSIKNRWNYSVSRRLDCSQTSSYSSYMTSQQSTSDSDVYSSAESDVNSILNSPILNEMLQEFDEENNQKKETETEVDSAKSNSNYYENDQDEDEFPYNDILTYDDAFSINSPYEKSIYEMIDIFD
ncbi:Myb-like DNA-binding domain containing protein [Tritrichomonas foetus]|uniref:Myb-like DNA-binding domain containing protein n=1 Tax=Tritrichomonas foetus TaxID=1144522 RepID=A0A1J4KRD7_9EUKA|nr:Myb-like DNA-binding domain containing protein [Tritrichomonas foetus]|eukprot:OHT13496.1 Myb-like DNA-binding domain containing protein [Tritrichomonas foetus]